MEPVVRLIKAWLAANPSANIWYFRRHDGDLRVCIYITGTMVARLLVDHGAPFHSEDDTIGGVQISPDWIEILQSHLWFALGSSYGGFPCAECILLTILRRAEIVRMEEGTDRNYLLGCVNNIAPLVTLVDESVLRCVLWRDTFVFADIKIVVHEYLVRSCLRDLLRNMPSRTELTPLRY